MRTGSMTGSLPLPFQHGDDGSAGFAVEAAMRAEAHGAPGAAYQWRLEAGERSRLATAVAAGMAAVRLDWADGMAEDAEGPVAHWAALHDYADANAYVLHAVAAVPEWSGLEVDSPEWWSVVGRIEEGLGAALAADPLTP